MRPAAVAGPLLALALALALPLLLAVAGPARAGQITDARGRVVRADAPQRIVVLGATLAEGVAALGLADRVVGADAGTAALPALADKAVLGYHRQVGAEGVLALRPDLVLATEAAGPPAALAQLEAAGLKLVVLPDAPGAEAAAARVEALGALLDRPAAAAPVAAALRAELARLQAAPWAGPPPRVLFVYARGAGALTVAGADTAADAMIRAVGAANAAAGFTGYKPLTAEAAVGARPDVVLLTTRGLAELGGEAAVLGQPGLAALHAARPLKVLAIDDLALLGFGPGAVAGARALRAGLEAP